MRPKMRWSMILTCALVLTLAGVLAHAQPKTETLSGTIIDLTCAAKGKAMMDSWHNAENDEHKTPDGPKPGCAEMCLRGGQPAALFADNEIQAVFGCNPRATLADYAAQEVDVQGFWGGSKEDDARTFIPAKIRKKGESEWKDVDCATMHG